MEQLLTAVIVAPFVITMVGFAVAIVVAPAVPNEIAPATGHDHDGRQLFIGPHRGGGARKHEVVFGEMAEAVSIFGP
jgi:hypothetical protein